MPPTQWLVKEWYDSLPQSGALFRELHHVPPSMQPHPGCQIQTRVQEEPHTHPTPHRHDGAPQPLHQLPQDSLDSSPPQTPCWAAPYNQGRTHPKILKTPPLIFQNFIKFLSPPLPVTFPSPFRRTSTRSDHKFSTEPINPTRSRHHRRAGDPTGVEVGVEDTEEEGEEGRWKW